MTERKWTPNHNRGNFYTTSEFVAYTLGFREAVKATAAPDLYEALGRALAEWDSNTDWRDQARAALAKARGE